MSESACKLSCCTGIDPIVSEPVKLRYSPAIRCAKLDLPEPESPTTAHMPCAGSVIVMLRNTGTLAHEDALAADGVLSADDAPVSVPLDNGAPVWVLLGDTSVSSLLGGASVPAPLAATTPSSAASSSRETDGYANVTSLNSITGSPSTRAVPRCCSLSFRNVKILSLADIPFIAT